MRWPVRASKPCEGLFEQRRRARDEQAHAGRDFAREVGAREQAHVVGRHAHQHARPRQRAITAPASKRGRKIIRAPAKQRRVDRHEQAVRVVDRQHVEQHVGRAEAPGLAQRQRVRGEVALGQHRALGAPGRARSIEDRGEVVGGARDARESFRAPPRRPPSASPRRPHRGSAPRPPPRRRAHRCRPRAPDRRRSRAARRRRRNSRARPACSRY